MPKPATYSLVAIKRDWCPEWLFALCRFIVPIYPFRWLFTQKVQAEQEKPDA
jgi:hypothetical protein